MLSCRPVGATPKPFASSARREKPGGAVSMAGGCLLVLVLCAGVGYGVYRYLPQAPDRSPTVPGIFAGIIGLLGGLALSSAWSLLRGHGRGTSALGALLERAKTDGAVEDGKPIVATGLVRSERPLTSPLGGIRCVAYDYRMYTTRRGSKGRPEQVPVYWGYAGVPCALDSRARRYPIASVPFFTWDNAPVTDDAGKARARSYVRSTGWETIEYGMLGTLDTVLRRVGDDSTTGTRKDFALAYDEAPDVALLMLEERVLPIEATASAFGEWSGALGAIVAPASPLPASAAVVTLGGPEGLDGAPGVPQTTRSYVATVFILLALAGGVFWFATIAIPTLRP